MVHIPSVYGNELAALLEDQNVMIDTVWRQHSQIIRCFQAMRQLEFSNPLSFDGIANVHSVMKPSVCEIREPKSSMQGGVNPSIEALAHPSNLVPPPELEISNVSKYEPKVVSNYDPMVASVYEFAATSITEEYLPDMSDTHSPTNKSAKNPHVSFDFSEYTVDSPEESEIGAFPPSKKSQKSATRRTRKGNAHFSQKLRSRTFDRLSLSSKESMPSITTMTKTKLALYKKGIGSNKHILSGAEGPWPDYILDPQSTTIAAWNCFVALAVVYICFFVPFSICISWWIPPLGIRLLSTALELIFWIDVIVTFRTAYVRRGHVVTSAKAIAMKYMSFWFWVDMLANIPWEFVLGFLFSPSQRKTVKMLKWFKLPRLIRLGTLRKLFNSVGGRGKYMNLLFNILALVFAIHFGACAWVNGLGPCDQFQAGMLSGDESAALRDTKLGWLCRQASIFPIYLQALHISSSVIFGNHVASGGSVDNGYFSLFGYAEQMHQEVDSVHLQIAGSGTKPIHFGRVDRLRTLFPYIFYDESLAGSAGVELHDYNKTHHQLDGAGHLSTWGLNYWNWMFTSMIIVQIVGLVLISNVTAHLIKIVLTSNWEETYFRMQTESVGRELEHYGALLSEQTQIQVHQYFRWRLLNADFGPLKMLAKNFLTPSARRELSVMLYGDLVMNSLAIFDVNMHAAVCMALQPQVYMRGQIIYRRGDPQTGLYILQKGRVQLKSVEDDGENEIFEECQEFDTFGEIDILDTRLTKHPTHNHSAKATDVCRVLHIDVGTLKETARTYPALVELFLGEALD